MTKIAIFPGSFDPIHNGHLAIAKLMAQTHDMVFLVPSGVSPNKAHKIQTPGPTRARWIHSCIQASEDSNNGKIRLSTFESNQNRRTYTLDTILHFQKEFPQAELSLVCGADTAKKINKWPSAPTIHKIAKLAIIPRNGEPGNATDQGWDLSSSQIRRYITEGYPIKSLIPKEILKEILHTFAPKNTKEHQTRIEHQSHHISKSGNQKLAQELLDELQIFLEYRRAHHSRQSKESQKIEQSLEPS